MPTSFAPPRASALLMSTALACMLTTARAQEADPLWQQTRQHLRSLQGLAAGQVDFRISQQGEQARTLFRAVERLQGWEGGLARRVMQAHHESPLQSLVDVRPPPALNPADHPDQALLGIDTVRRAEREPGAEPHVQVFDIEGHFEVLEFLAGRESRSSVPFSGRVRVRIDDGAPLNLVYRIEGIPFTTEFRYQVDFTRDERWQRHVPREARMLVSTRLPLVGSSTVDRQLQFSDWQERPQ